MLSPNLPVVLRGYGYDQDFNDLPPDALHWTSDQDGDLGTGEVLQVSLSPGWHTITLFAQDETGLTAQDTVRIYVGSVYQTWMPIIHAR